MLSSFATDRGKQLIIIPQEQKKASKQLFWIVVWDTMPPRAICKLIQFTYHCLLKLVLKKHRLSKVISSCVSSQVWNQTSFLVSSLTCLLPEIFCSFTGGNGRLSPNKNIVWRSNVVPGALVGDKRRCACWLLRDTREGRNGPSFVSHTCWWKWGKMENLTVFLNNNFQYLKYFSILKYHNIPLLLPGWKFLWVPDSSWTNTQKGIWAS